MAKDPAVLFYTSDFLSGTITFTNEEIGAYIKLLCIQREQGHIERDIFDAICGHPMPKVLKKFSIDENGMLFQHRMDEEIRKRNNYINAQTENGKKGGRPKKTKTHGFDLGLAKENPIGNENININDNSNIRKREAEEAQIEARFKRFWGSYPRKVQKIDARRAFAKLNPDDELLGAIIKAVEASKGSKDWTDGGGAFIPYPATYLNGRRWEDEPTEINPRFGNFDATEAMDRAIARSFKKENQDEN